MAGETQKVIVLTGASGGIGQALAREFAGPGIYFALIARDQTRLEALLKEIRTLGADGEINAVDIRDRDALHGYLSDLEKRHPLDLVIANAGVTAGLGPDRTRESDADSDRQIDVNYRGVVNTISGVVDGMQKRRKGQLVLISSLAGMRALPDMPSYSASKAALIGYGHSLRGWLKPFGVSVTIICPGFVTSPMSARHKGAKPFEMPASKAATLMRRAIDCRKPFYAFPFLLAWGIRLQNLLPTKIGDLFMGGFDVTIDQDPRYREGSDK
ncbi:putative oxidoreductase [Stappia aggregata IAM 12614]|uniref:Putative oxidoreductase n=1 Tax=Roseibium aggregatum (strain ATCC 25650 / DSM 13394 / JCM 20685 / NBRC 16684 / NCIMB 2208 / IAM 12614 / B1) TaxID=384765 RepID=A0NU16_ROSAI|nr:SDR family NAD(P)-dependent oxidoreductase [Roseibium aggregatum]EAV43925.1 putative oxidoreductase [Stappia aggregata IAM 12614] [Roseibium aggregatum IAM 12614]